MTDHPVIERRGIRKIFGATASGLLQALRLW